MEMWYGPDRPLPGGFVNRPGVLQLSELAAAVKPPRRASTSCWARALASAVVQRIRQRPQICAVGAQHGQQRVPAHASLAALYQRDEG